MSDATTKQAFLLEKAHNFKEFIARYGPSPTLQTTMEGFNEAMLLPTIATVVVPIVKSGAQASAVSDFMTNLNVPQTERQAVEAKLLRYLTMFSEVLLS